MAPVPTLSQHRYSPGSACRLIQEPVAEGLFASERLKFLLTISKAIVSDVAEGLFASERLKSARQQRLNGCIVELQRGCSRVSD